MKLSYILRLTKLLSIGSVAVWLFLNCTVNELHSKHFSEGNFVDNCKLIQTTALRIQCVLSQ
jgi:hypothetical protein